MKILGKESIIEELDKNSQFIIEYFISYYKDSSALTYRNVFRRICENTNKKQISSLDFQDYCILKQKYNKSQIIPQIFRFLYAFKCLDNSEDFATEFGNIENYRNKLEKKINSKKEKTYKPVISTRDLDKLIMWVKKADVNDFDSMRIAFCFHMLFYEGLSVNEVRNLDVKYFELGSFNLQNLETDEDPIGVPVKFHSLLEDLKKNESNTKFSQVNQYISELGEIVGINDLHPKDITAARKQRFIVCPECGKDYFASLENWFSVNNYLLCETCFNKLPQSERIKKNEITNKLISSDLLNMQLDLIKYSDEIDIDYQDLINFDSINPPNPELKIIIIARLVRDTKNARKLKEKYDNRCQLCGCQLIGANGGFFSEAHHIQPYNKKHKGGDTYKNLIVLCPNHHAQFDQLYYAIEPQTHKIHCLYDKDLYHLAAINMEPGHYFDQRYLECMWKKFCEKKGGVMIPNI
jgi:hypothetical protein